MTNPPTPLPFVIAKLVRQPGRMTGMRRDEPILLRYRAGSASRPTSLMEIDEEWQKDKPYSAGKSFNC